MRNDSKRKQRAMDPKFEPLSRYNGEVARGLVHTPEWQAKMAVLQAEFDGRGSEWGGKP